MAFSLVDAQLWGRAKAPGRLLQFEGALHRHALIGPAVKDEHWREAPHSACRPFEYPAGNLRDGIDPRITRADRH